LNRRRPGQSHLTTQRLESDECQFLSGIFDGQSTGAPIALLIENQDQRSRDYDALAQVYRPGHADRVYDAKYGIRDHRGGGRSSARITAAWVAAGSLAQQYLESKHIVVRAWVHQIEEQYAPEYTALPSIADIDQSAVRCPDPATAMGMQEAIERAHKAGDSVGGSIRFQIEGMQAGIGEPLFGKIQAQLAHYLLNIPATTGIEFGAGFAAARMRGSEHNDAWIHMDGQGIKAASNRAGGSLGGISTGEPLYGLLAFKPVSSIHKTQQTVSREGESVELNIEGRHDPCVLPRAVPIVEAMTALCIMDLYLENALSQS
ncbi:MAG: chorismate synthase, partial [Bacteroidia bacterium]